MFACVRRGGTFEQECSDDDGARCCYSLLSRQSAEAWSAEEEHIIATVHETTPAGDRLGKDGRSFGLDSAGGVVIRRKCSRKQLLAFIANLQARLIGMEACSGSHLALPIALGALGA